ncbi:CPBP family intramembrane glutamic endopeptidase, partial [Dethiobacter alkaliphilus]|uniref:CPBP family intramembrane glutamic endopeptidase n=1 Tax=Dethiobacter alkaliphilus TaxID=427926 RepID=UPI002227B170
VFLPGEPSEIHIVISILAQWIVLLGLLYIWLPRVERSNLSSIGFNKFEWSYLGTGLLTYIILFILMAFTGYFLEIAGLQGLRSLQPVLSGYSFPVLFGLFITGTFLEEVFYRGYIIERIILLTGKRWLAGVTSWLTFTLVHFNFFGLGPTLEVSVFSAVVTILYLKKRSIWPVIIVHGINNILAYLIFPVL